MKTSTSTTDTNIYGNFQTMNQEQDVFVEATRIDDSAVNTGGDNCRPDKKERRRQIGGAAAVGGVAGLVLAGPVVGLVAAGGAAAVAASKGKPGEVARATGNVAAHAGDRLKKFDKKHKVTKKASDGIIKGANWVSNKIAVKKKNGNPPPNQQSSFI